MRSEKGLWGGDEGVVEWGRVGARLVWRRRGGEGEDGVACGVARVRSLAIPGLFGGRLVGVLRAQREL